MMMNGIIDVNGIKMHWINGQRITMPPITKPNHATR